MSRVNLATYQPKFYKNSEFMAVLNGVIESELELLKTARIQMKSEAMARTSEKWINTWENSVALPSDTGLTLAQRQSRVLARLRQMDTTTVERVKIIIESYANGEVEVVERYTEYIVEVNFISLRGIPDNMNGIIEQLNRLMPAHLQVIYNYKYRTWGEVLQTGLTWREILNRGYTWRDILEEDML